ncbi:hypothetical protein DCAR_0522458 [Daucus carota subsp. sativus]|uniref:Uncharacterized protein n=1 Tax=Daucus carota subsp. sativus TaxID=79200 RepID=A0A164ZTW4_DAUCS|nr:hypothetical protein DCAR_0522458 [Daucus carota subsp. sativus]
MNTILPLQFPHLHKNTNHNSHIRKSLSTLKANQDHKTTTDLTSKNVNTQSILKFDRRNVLLGLAGASYIATNNTKLTNAAPSNPKVFPNADQIFPSVLDKFVKFTVPRPKKSRSKQEKEDEEEILVIEGIEYNANEYVKFDVFVNDEDEAESGPSNAEFAGAFSNVPSATRSKKVRTRLSLGISELLEDLGAEDDDNLVVALVSRTGQGRVNIGSVSIVISS